MPTIFITGTSKGIGKAAAEEFLKQGWIVIGTSTSNTCPINHQNYRHQTLNLSDNKTIAKLIQSIEKNSLDCLLNNAAILLEDRTNPKVDLEKLDTTLQINLIGPIKMTEKLLIKMQKNGRIINISSNWGSFSDPNFDSFHPYYKISKAALNMYTKLLASRRPDITTIAFDPGWVKTEMGGSEATRSPNDVAKNLLWLVNAPAKTGSFYYKKEPRKW